MDLENYCESFKSPLQSQLASAKRENVAAMLLGVAIGDALGNPTEYLLPEERIQRFGFIESYVSIPGRESGIGYPTDDTQLTFHTLEQLTKDQCFEPEQVMRRLCSLKIIKPGLTIRNACFKARTTQQWTRSGMPSSGNGALMRMTPFLVPWIRTRDCPDWNDLSRATLLTHNDPRAIFASLLVGRILVHFLVKQTPLLSTTIFKLIQETLSTSGKKSLRVFKDKVIDQLESGIRGDWTTLEAAKRWGSGADLTETLPIYLHIIIRHASEPELAILEAVNYTQDNDTIGSLVASAMGALHGKRAFRKCWVQDLSGAVDGLDDGRVFQVIDNMTELYY